MGKEIRVEGREGNKINGRIYTPEPSMIYNLISWWGSPEAGVDNQGFTNLISDGGLLKQE